jgi:4-hydroxymandelate oxidase
VRNWVFNCKKIGLQSNTDLCIFEIGTAMEKLKSFKPLNLFEYEQLATKCLSQMALDYYASGAWDEVTLRDNRAAFERFKLRPRVLVDVSDRNLATKILGQPLQMPLFIAPMAFQCLANPQGEVATARAAASAGVGMVLSTLSTKSIEEVAAVCHDTNLHTPQWFQLYITKTGD